MRCPECLSPSVEVVMCDVNPAKERGRAGYEVEVMVAFVHPQKPKEPFTNTLSKFIQTAEFDEL